MAETTFFQDKEIQQRFPETLVIKENNEQPQPVSQSKIIITTAGRIQRYIDNWEQLTTDSVILDIVRGCQIDFIQKPYQLFIPKETVFSAKEQVIVEFKLAKLLKKKVITPSHHEEGLFISKLFLTPKKDGSFRLILNLNLKQFKVFVQYQHFKMESLNHVVHIMKPGCFMASLDIRDAYYSVPIHEQHQKYLKFQWNC